VEHFEKYTGILKTICHHELKGHTELGWTVIDAFDQTEVVERSAMETRMVPVSPGGYDCNGTVPTMRHYTESQHYFVVRLDETAQLAKLTNEIAQLKSTLKANGDELQKSVKTIAAQGEERLLLQEQIVSRDRTLGKMTDSQREERDRMRKMEQDLGKLRQALGEIRMREILKETT
jgi:hypothetical protein